MNVLLILAAAVGLVVQAAHCPNGNQNGTENTRCTFTGISGKISRIDLSNCSIETFCNFSFNSLENLRILDVSRNKITDLSEDFWDVFENVTTLRELDLSNNLIHVIYESPFRTFQTLRLLNLSANSINVISVNGFRGPESLQILDLSGNNLTELPDNVFVPLVSLQHLNLSGNKLRTLADGCFGSLLKLQQLDVSWNQLNHVAPSTLQALPSLSRLLLADNPNLGNGIKEAALLVGTGRRLQTVDASRTGLKHVPATLTHSVRTLRLAGNSIRVVRCGDLDSYPLLQLLDLTLNKLEEIEEDALGRLEMLAVLYLTNNKLRAIPRSLPDRLEILHLEFNKIEQIVSGDLLGLPKLEVLLLNDNVIKVVQEGAFNQVTSLVTLDLSHNPISILPGDTLAGPSRLQMLRLSQLTVDPPAEDMAFPVPAPEHLVRLDLSGSAGLARQLLADTAALAAFRELQELNLANTDLINIRSDLLYYLPQMHEFHITGNRLNCSGLLWLAMWMRRQDLVEYRSVTCVYPPELYGTLVVDLQDTDVQEITSTTTLKTTITTTTLQATIEYKTETDPTMMEEATTISWLKENAFNNITFEEQVNRSSVRSLQNTVKSLTEVEKVEHVSDRRMVENTERKEDQEKPDRSTITAGQLHLFPADKTETAPPVTDGHIDEINPSDNRIVTEPSNYKTNVPPTKIVPRENQTIQPATAALRDNTPIYVNHPNTNKTKKEQLIENAIPAPPSTILNESETNLSGTVGVTSMYAAGVTVTQSWMGLRPSPGLFALLAAALGTGAALCSLLSHVRRKRLRRAMDVNGYDRHQDIEVNSLTSVHELW